MADLEKLALKRDRRYLVRLVGLLAIGTVFGLQLFRPLTGSHVGGCIADAYLGRGSQSGDPGDPHADDSLGIPTADDPAPK